MMLVVYCNLLHLSIALIAFCYVRLQDKVKETIVALRDAGMKVITLHFYNFVLLALLFIQYSALLCSIKP